MNIKLAEAVLSAVSACPEFKEAAQSFINAFGTEKEAEAEKNLVAQAEDGICGIDDVLGFFGSSAAETLFGALGAKEKLAHAQEIKAQGAVYCDCPACKAAKAILDYAE